MVRECRNCEFFIADDPLLLTTGVCRRHAPRGNHYQSFGLADQQNFVVEMGTIDGAGTVFEDAITPLYLGGGSTVGLYPSCPPNNLAGVNSNNIMPATIISDAYAPVFLEVFASRMCSGAATVGLNPVLHLVAVSVRGNDCLAGWTADIPIRPSTVGVKNSVTDIFVRESLDLDVLGFSGPLGLRLDLTGATENDIAQIRNFKIGVLFARRSENIGVNPVTSKSKWATISESTKWCGEFKPRSDTL